MKNLLNFTKEPNANQCASFNHNAAIAGISKRQRRNSIQSSLGCSRVRG